MKNKLKRKLIILFITLAALFLFGGCSFGTTLEEIKSDWNLTARVTYYANGGELNGTPDIADMHYKEGQKPINIGKVGTSDGTLTIKRANYEFEGWYHAVDVTESTDKDGNTVYTPKYNAELKSYELGEEVDFTKPLSKDEHLHFVAKWVPTVKVDVILVCEEGLEGVTGKPTGSSQEVFIENGKPIYYREYQQGKCDDPQNRPPFSSVKEENKKATATFVGYYKNIECTEAVEWPLRLAEGQTENDVYYAKYVKGDWNMLRTPDDVKEMFLYDRDTKAANYYLLNDIDMKDTPIACNGADYREEFNGTLKSYQGSYTISNLKITLSAIESGSKISLFGKLGATAVMENVTFENISLEYSFKSNAEVEVYFVFSSIHSAAIANIKNIKINGAMNITVGSSGAVIDNIQKGESYSYEHCLFGGNSYTTDEEYLAAAPHSFIVNDGNAAESFITIK